MATSGPIRAQAGTCQNQATRGSNLRKWIMKPVTQTGDASKRWNGTKVNGSPGRIHTRGIGGESCNRVGDADSERTNRGRPEVRKRPLIGSSFSFHAREDRSRLGRRMDSTWRLFNRGHALPLISIRFWCPRIRRARDAEFAFEMRPDGRNGSRGRVIA